MQKAVVALLLIDALDEGLALPASSNEVTRLLLCEALESTLKLGVEQLPALQDSFRRGASTRSSTVKSIHHIALQVACFQVTQLHMQDTIF